MSKNKRDYFGNLSNNIVTDNKNFWKTMSPILSQQTSCRKWITIKESNKTITNNEELAKALNLNIDNDLRENAINPDNTN